VLPVGFLSSDSLFSGAGGFAAAIAIGVFLGQVRAVLSSTPEEMRRRETAVGGLIGFGVMIGLILLSASGR
jgi:hypothetical protein